MILEIRTYRLRPGTRAEFLRVMREEGLPLLEKFGLDAVAWGPSVVNEDGHEEAFIMRAFASTEERDEQEEAFYGSPDWHDGPRLGIVTPIVSYHTIVIETSAEAVEALRT